MASRPVTWFQVARRPKWIGALFIAMAVAAACAGLAGWQAERSFEKAVTDTQQTVSQPLDSLITAGQAAGAGAVGSLASAQLMIDNHNTFIVSGRVQRDGSQGFWLIAAAYDEKQNIAFVTLGFSADLAKVEAARSAFADSMQAQAFMPYEGLLMPSEAPVLSSADAKPYLLNSLSLGQLINLLPTDAIYPAPKAYPLFLLLTKPNPGVSGLEAVNILPASAEVQVNWLSAFYAAEWTLFCGFAFFLWWRLVRDAQLVENGERETAQG